MKLEELHPNNPTIFIVIVGKLPVADADIWRYDVVGMTNIFPDDFLAYETTYQKQIDFGNSITKQKYKALTLQILEFNVVKGTTSKIYERVWYKEPKPLKILNRENNASNQDSENSSVSYDTITTELENDF